MWWRVVVSRKQQHTFPNDKILAVCTFSQELGKRISSCCCYSTSLESRVSSQGWYWWHLGLDSSLLWGVVWCLVGCLTKQPWPLLDDSGTPPHQSEQPKMSSDIAKCLLGGKITLLENHCFRDFRQCSRTRRINRCYIWKGKNTLLYL